MKKDLLVCSFSSMGKDSAQKLVESCSRYGYNLDYQDFPFQNFRQFKIDSMLDYLKSVNNEHVMYTDATDTWFLRKNIFNVYRNHFGEDAIVVSGNRDHYPQTQLYDMTKEDEYFSSHTSFRFICSSQFIGPRLKLIELFTIMQKEYQGMVDQEGWHYIKVKNLYPFHIDKDCRLFLNMTQVRPDEVDQFFRLKETWKFPCSIHFGGPKGADLNAIAMSEMFGRWQSGY